jgi:hypothetical protein
MTEHRELKGALFFSKEHPHITGYLVVDGIEYEIAGWHASHIRAEIQANKRGKLPVQADIFDGERDGHSEPSKSECDQP